MQTKLEKQGFDIMMQIKNDMFKQDQENDHLIELRQYCKVYDTFIEEIDEKMQKYT